MLSDMRAGRATEVGGDETVWIRIEPNRKQMAKTGLGPNEVQGGALIERHPDDVIRGVDNPEHANLVDEENWIYEGVFSEKRYQVDEDQSEDN